MSLSIMVLFPTETNSYLTVNLCFFITLNPVSWHIPFTCPSWCENQQFWLYSWSISCSKPQEQKNTHSALINFVVHLSCHPSSNRGRIFSTHSIENDLNSEMKWNKAGYRATLIACGWAGAIYGVTRAFGKKPQGLKPRKQPTNQRTDKAGCRVA